MTIKGVDMRQSHLILPSWLTLTVQVPPISLEAQARRYAIATGLAAQGLTPRPTLPTHLPYVLRMQHKCALQRMHSRLPAL